MYEEFELTTRDTIISVFMILIIMSTMFYLVLVVSRELPPDERCALATHRLPPRRRALMMGKPPHHVTSREDCELWCNIVGAHVGYERAMRQHNLQDGERTFFW